MKFVMMKDTTIFNDLIPTPLRYYELSHSILRHSLPKSSGRKDSKDLSLW